MWKTNRFHICEENYAANDRPITCLFHNKKIRAVKRVEV